MSNLAATGKLFFERHGLDRKRAQAVIDDALMGSGDGELFLECRQSESLVFDDGRLKNASFDASQGFGLRAVSGEASVYCHSSELSEEALLRAAAAAKAARFGISGTMALPPLPPKRMIYADDNPIDQADFAFKAGLLSDIDAYVRGKDESVRQVTASLYGEWQAVHIMRQGGCAAADIRPLVSLNVSVVAAKNGRMEAGSYGCGGRFGYRGWLSPETWKAAADEALRQALLNLQSVAAPAGEKEVVLGPGWPGIMLHEAVGHGLEGDFNRKKTSAFTGLVGQAVAAAGVTVIDDGSIQDRRGSITIDDEGTPSGRAVLIENGILKGYLFDRLNARLMGMISTGNGRRQSYAHAPIPRMTNTFMLAGSHDPGEIISSVNNGLYAAAFGGGQVDITSGKFVFSCTEAYLIEGGRIGAPVKGATLIGSGPEVLKKISMIGNDLKLDPGIGTCGKDGQGAPVGVGQPTLKIGGLTVGGTAA